MTAVLSATEALLAQAAAVTRTEIHAARLQLVARPAAIRPMDRALLVAGDGTAGRTLLGAERPGPWPGPGPSCAIRSTRLLGRVDAQPVDHAARAGAVR